MVKNDLWSEPADGLNDLEALTNQRNTAFFDYTVDAAQFSQLATNEDTTSSSQPPIIPKTSLSAPIISEDIWGDDIGRSTVIETPFSPDQKLYVDTEPIKEWIENEEQLVEEDDNTLFLSENSNEISASPIVKYGCQVGRTAA